MAGAMFSVHNNQWCTQLSKQQARCRIHGKVHVTNGKSPKGTRRRQDKHNPPKNMRKGELWSALQHALPGKEISAPKPATETTKFCNLP